MNRRMLAAGGAATACAMLLVTPAVGSVSVPGPKAPNSLQVLRAQVRNATLTSTHGVRYDCAALRLNCEHNLVTTGLHSTQVLSTTRPAGWGAGELAKAYGVSKAPSADGTITILDAGAYPNLESDLAVYRKQYHLPPCTKANGCLTIKSFRGGPPLRPPKTDPAKQRTEAVEVETALDVDMASATCPGCKIIELQLPITDAFDGSQRHNDRESRDFGTAVRTAVKMHTDVVSISYGNPVDKYVDTNRPARALDQKGIAIFASSGDSGYFGTGGRWPENLRTVIAVGGTVLSADGSRRGYAETAWAGAGSGCSPDLGPAIGQPKSVSANCKNKRASTDISAVAVNVAVYDTYAPFSGHPHNWIVVGGTSVSAPLVAGIAARAHRNAAVHGPNLLYGDPANAFNDVTTGQNGTAADCKGDGFTAKVCVAGKGWDGPTGLGTPDGLKPFAF